MNSNEHNHIYEDEIDLAELFLTLKKYKKFIFIMTLATVLSVAAYLYFKTPLYEARANIQIGFIGYDKEGEKRLVDDPKSIAHLLKVVFFVDDKLKENNSSAYIDSIGIDKKVKGFLSVSAFGISNKTAQEKIQELLSYLQKRYQPKIDQFIQNTTAQILTLQHQADHIKTYEIPQTHYAIKKIKTQSIPQIEEKIKQKYKKIEKINDKITLITTQEIPAIDSQIDILSKKIEKLNDEISLIKTKKIPLIDKKILFLRKEVAESINNKITNYEKKLKQYTTAVENLARSSIKDPATQTVISVQMLNYQNLILNAQNTIENLKTSLKEIEIKKVPQLQNEKAHLKMEMNQLAIKIDNIRSIDIKNLQNKKTNLKKITLKDLETQIETIKSIEIKNLENQKENLLQIELIALQDKLATKLPNKLEQIKQRIQSLRYMLKDTNVQNSTLVSEIRTQDKPAKPKTKLILAVALITGLILGVFAAFFLEFIRNIDKNKEVNGASD